MAENLGDYLKEVSNWSWESFCRAELDEEVTSDQMTILTLIRSCAMEQLPAIKIALNRLDGKLVTPVKIEYPKIYCVYPNATLDATSKQVTTPVDLLPSTSELQVVSGEMIDQDVDQDVDQEQNDLPSLSLRQTLTKMGGYSRALPPQIIDYATQTQQWVNGMREPPPSIPKVKSVIAAHLLALAHRRNIGAITEVFDQIDGKLAETIQIIAPDIHLVNYATTAPPGAYLNKNGEVEVQDAQIQDMWRSKLGG